MGLCGSTEAVETQPVSSTNRPAPQKQTPAPAVAPAAASSQSTASPVASPPSSTSSPAPAKQIEQAKASVNPPREVPNESSPSMPLSGGAKHISEDEIEVKVAVGADEEEAAAGDDEDAVFYEQEPVTPKAKASAVTSTQQKNADEVDAEEEVKRLEQLQAELKAESEAAPKRLDPAMMSEVDPTNPEALLAQVNAMISAGFVPTKSMLESSGGDGPAGTASTGTAEQSSAPASHPARGHQRVSSLADELRDFSAADSDDSE